MRRSRRHLLALALGTTLVLRAQATPSPEEDKVIAQLIERVGRMQSLQFMRNGKAHTATEAVEHMQAKYAHFRKEIVTAEDFIDRCASRSEMTGKPYMVRLADGREHTAKVFMMNELRSVRQQGR